MARLVVNPSSSSRRELALGRNALVSIGRDPTNDLVLPDALVSRRHAVIECRGAQYYFRDCNSSNGSLVNGDRVSERPLRDGDLVSIGTARILFRDEEHDEAGAKVLKHPSAPKLQCPSCAADFRTGDQFCRQCGHALAPAGPPRAVCTACGTSVALPARFCNACGLPLAGAAAADASEGGDGDAELEGAEREGAEREETQPHDVVRGGPPAGAVAASPAPRPEPAMSVPPPVPAAPPARPVSAPPLARSGAAAPAASMPQRAAARPVAVRPVPVGTPAPRALPHRHAPAPVGFGARFVAGLIDGAIVTTGQLLLIAPVFYYWWTHELEATPADVPFLPIVLSLGLVPVVVALGLVYYVYFWGVRGATPGKAAMGLVVETDDGVSPIGVSRAAVRALGYLASGLLLGAGFLMIAFGGTGLHDRMAGTRVMRRGEGI